MRKSQLGVLLILGLVTWPASVLAERYEVVPGSGTEIVFQSRAPMEKFEGKTGKVQGWLSADVSALDQAVEMEVRVDLASFDTGMGKRNTHMRENHFETDKYPQAIFRGGQVSGQSATALAVGEKVDLTLTGTLDLHGVHREMSCEVTLTRPSEGELQVEARFEVLLPDHRIKRPKFLIMKLAEDQKVIAKLILKKES